MLYKLTWYDAHGKYCSKRFWFRSNAEIYARTLRDFGISFARWYN